MVQLSRTVEIPYAVVCASCFVMSLLAGLAVSPFVGSSGFLEQSCAGARVWSGRSRARCLSSSGHLSWCLQVPFSFYPPPDILARCPETIKKTL